MVAVRPYPAGSIGSLAIVEICFMKAWLYGFLLLPLAAGAAPLGATSPVTLRFEPGAVVAQGITPGAQVVWFSIAREPQGYISRVVRREDVVSADSEGRAVFPLAQGAPFKSIWVAVDLADGRFAVAAPEGSPLREVDFPADGVRPVGGLMRELHDSRGAAEILVVRPGVGAWGLSVADGGRTDEDGANDGALVSSLREARAIGGGPATPEHFSPKDVLVMIDPQGMEFYAVSLPEEARR
jgi:hypothetical protein